MWGKRRGGRDLGGYIGKERVAKELSGGGAAVGGREAVHEERDCLLGN